MDHIAILKNALQTTLRYRALWILGVIWFLVGGSVSSGYFGNPGGIGGNGPRYNLDSGSLPGWNPAQFMGALILLCGIFLILLAVAAVLRYVLQAGIYRTLYRLEAEGRTPTVAAGFRQGWHRRTWRLVLQNWLVGIPFFLAALLLLALAASPLLLLLADSDVLTAIGIVFAIGLFLGWIGFLILIGAVLSVLQQFWWRLAVIADQGAIPAIRMGWRLVRQNLADVAIMWLLLMGIDILVFVLMIPVMLLLATATGILAGGPGYLIYSLTGSVALALLWAAPLGILIFLVPTVFFGGLYLIYRTAVWNQVFTQLAQRTSLLLG